MCQVLHENCSNCHFICVSHTDNFLELTHPCDESMPQELQCPGFRATLPLPRCVMFRKVTQPLWGVNGLAHTCKAPVPWEVPDQYEFVPLPSISDFHLWLHIAITWGTLKKKYSWLSSSSRDLHLIGPGFGLAIDMGSFKYSPGVNLKYSQGWEPLVLIESSSITRGASEWCNECIANHIGPSYQNWEFWELLTRPSTTKGKDKGSVSLSVMCLPGKQVRKMKKKPG